jgi:hypothetical protein
MFFGLVMADLEALFAAVHPLPKGVSELVCDDGSGYPVTDFLEDVLGQRDPSQF